MRYVTITFYKQKDGQIDEQIGFAKRLKSSDQQTCNVILDYKERKVVKCVVESKVLDTTFERMHDYYKQIYPTLIEQMELANNTHKKNEKPA